MKWILHYATIMDRFHLFRNNRAVFVEPKQPLPRKSLPIPIPIIEIKESSIVIYHSSFENLYQKHVKPPCLHDK